MLSHTSPQDAQFNQHFSTASGVNRDLDKGSVLMKQFLTSGMNQDSLPFKSTEVLVPYKMTSTGQIPRGKYKSQKGKEGKGVCTTLNLVNTDFFWRLTLSITSFRKSSLNARVHSARHPKYASVPDLDHSVMKLQVCASPPPQHKLLELFIPAPNVLSGHSCTQWVLWTETRKCMLVCACARAGLFEEVFAVMGKVAYFFL